MAQADSESGRASAVTATFPGTLDSLQGISAFVVARAVEAGLDARLSYRLRLAVDELVTNIVVHSYKEGGCSGAIELAVYLDKDELRVEIEDTAAPYDPTAKPLPTEDELTRPLEERPIGGLGVFLASKSVDEFRYQRIGAKNRTTVCMRRESRT